MRSGALSVLAASLTLGASASFSPSCARADTAQSAISPSPVQDVLAFTRTDQWMAGLGLEQALRTQLEHRLASTRRDLLNPVYRVLSRQFAADALSARFRDIVAARTEPHELSRLVSFYQAALGQRYARADQQVHVDDVRSWLSAHPLSAARRALLERWVDASGALERYTVAVVTPATQLESALHDYNPRLGKRSEKELAAPMRSPEVRKSVVEHSARALHEFSDAELTALVQFEASREGRAYRAVELDAVKQVLEEAFAALSLELQALGERARPQLSNVQGE